MTYADLCSGLKTAGRISTGPSSLIHFFRRGSIKSEVHVIVLLDNCISCSPPLSQPSEAEFFYKSRDLFKVSSCWI